MAGILDEVMDGITEKEKKDGKTPPAAPPATDADQKPPAETPPKEGGEKPMHSYSSGFKDKYGEKK